MGRIRTGTRCAALRRDGRLCYATATWGRQHCPRHDPTVTWRPAGYPLQVRERALELYRQVGPAEAARQLGLKAGTIRVWAHREGISSPYVTYEWARDIQTWPATLAARDAAELRRDRRGIADLSDILALLT